MCGLSSISPGELTLLAIAVGLIAVATLNSDELNVLGNWLIGVGGIMVVAATQGAYLSGLESEKSHEEHLARQIELLREELDSLRKNRNATLSANK